MSRLPVIVIWGVGLIGGSLGMAWRRAGVAARIIGIDPLPLDTAIKLGAIDEAADDPAEALAQADVLVLAAPVRAIIAQAASHARYLRPGAVVTDVGSTKADIVQAWDGALPPGAAFVGGHPLFGREVGGVANASPDLPRGATWVLTPGGTTTGPAVETVERLASAVGATVNSMSPEEHDQRVAVASHLPQLAATALAATAQPHPDALALAAGGFRDTTRLASSPAEIWLDILGTNRPAILQALGEYRRVLAELEAAVQQTDTAALDTLFARAHEARRRL
ncbi:MAG TPA: prephenate dehydrogenase/arogenate dehydrogenase family protein [Symbiobacteriaceae bacterium]|nr:prephenate dehydrogenase/arogenate dehydrogenase family protein [Symbiobacteriaceae bacterium]